MVNSIMNIITYLDLISALTKSVLGYGFDAATAVSTVLLSSSSLSKLINSIDPIAVYARTKIRTPENSAKKETQKNIKRKMQ